eukprot:TRINITY_DN9654_c0_g1_i1.p1 TRINITY_DN9654_c0_g1~~TRINITY_DN9654_c0_g1_i1.p1  ORF type:complete len:205 (+),score=48.64 TRINITY_DN9654_c0_g1_i1:57-671(+)
MAIYQSKVLEGNWFEELEYKREEIRNYLEKKERGQLETVKKSLHKSLLNPTKLEPNHSDNYVRYDETVLILNQASEGCLATNILDPCPAPLKDMYNVTTTSLHMFPCVRNCWRLKRRGAGSNSDVLRYEDEFMIVTTEKLVEYPFYLTSLKGDITSVSKVSRNQLVAIEHNSTSNTIWRIQHPDPSKRLNAYQQPVEVCECTFR